MKFKQLLSLFVACLVLSSLIPGIASAETLRWQPCREIAHRWPADDDQSECAMVVVPVDYAEPGGRTINLAVSRIKASVRRDGVVFLNPGGPGGSGMEEPKAILRSKAADIGKRHDLIGFAPRGVGYSGGVTCKDDPTQPDPSLSEKEKARFEAERDGRNHQRCIDKDPEFIRSLTTANIARDMDRIRIALGVDKISYYGVSWGTALGAQYRSLFDSHVGKMLLDSVMPPTLDLIEIDRGGLTARENTFAEFAAWLARHDDVYHFGATQQAVTKAVLELRARQAEHLDIFDGAITSRRHDWPASARTLTALRDGKPLDSASPKANLGFGWDADSPGFSSFQQAAVMCNDSGGSRDFEEAWRARLQLIEELPISGRYGTEAVRCVGWPIPAKPWRFTSGSSPLQLVGHLYESVTPIGWARQMRAQVGGALLTVEDDVHGSLRSLPCAERAVDFFDTGRTTNDSCPGAPVPSSY